LPARMENVALHEFAETNKKHADNTARASNARPYGYGSLLSERRPRKTDRGRNEMGHARS